MDNFINLLVFSTSFSLIITAIGSLTDSKKNKAEILILFTLFTLWGFDALFFLSEEIHFYEKFPHLLYLFQPIEFFLGPVIYYYYRIMLDGKMKLDRLTVILFVPGILAILYFIPFFMKSPGAKLASVGFLNISNPLIRGIYLFIMYFPAPYILICMTLAVIYGRGVLSKKGISMILHKKILIAYTLLWITVIITIYYAILTKNSLLIKTMLFTINSIFILFYYLTRKYNDFFLLMQKDVSETKYKRTMLKGLNKNAVIERLEGLMTLENLYLDDSLSLKSLSDILNIKSYQLSEILNNDLNANFNSFINTYRVNAAKKMLLDNERMGIIHIAYQCGFNSKNVFNTAFLKFEGMTPTEYREKFRKKES